MVVDEAVDHLWEPENLKTKIQMVIPPWNNGPAIWRIFCPFFYWFAARFLKNQEQKVSYIAMKN